MDDLLWGREGERESERERERERKLHIQSEMVQTNVMKNRGEIHLNILERQIDKRKTDKATFERIKTGKRKYERKIDKNNKNMKEKKMLKRQKDRKDR